MKLSSMPVFMLIVIIFISSATYISSWRTDDEVNGIFVSWVVKHGKIYGTLEEKEKRFQIFKDNLMYIDSHNSNNYPYKLGLNKLADLSIDEYRLLYTRARKTDSRRKLSNRRSDRHSDSLSDVLPESVDWRTTGAIGPIKDQGYCGSCWAFSTIGSVEAINQIVTGNLITLSEQDLIDCDTTSYNQGCNGGYMDLAFDFIVKNGGIDSDADYPYTGQQYATCNNTRENAKVVTIDGHRDVAVNDESALQKVVAKQPVSVSIDANSMDFLFYASGIYNGTCGTNLDHAVVMVGYGAEDGIDYWIVRNSWGDEWGEQGYMRLERNVQEKEGKCGIAMEGSYPFKNGLNLTKRATILVPFVFLFMLELVLSLT